MRKYLSEKVLGMKPSGIRKFFDIASEMPDVISLGVGEPDFDTPWHIREAGIQALQGGKTFYTSNAGLIELREAIGVYMKKRYKIDIDPAKQVVITVGGSEAIDIALRAILNPGEEVVYPEPCFVSYAPCISLAGGVPVSVSLNAENEFRLTPEQLEAAITPKTKAILMSFPNNPTGAIMEKEDLEALVPVILEHDLLVITDEIYCELTYGGKEHVSIASLPGMQDRTIIVNGFSKSYAMTGWRMGYAVGHPDIIKQMTKVHQFAIMCAPTTSQYAAVEAMLNGDDDVEMMKNSYDQRRRYLYHEITRMGFECFEPKGAFYMFPSIKKFGMSSEDFCMSLLKEEEVAVVPGDSFGQCAEGYVRISYAASIADIKESVRRIERFVEHHS